MTNRTKTGLGAKRIFHFAVLIGGVSFMAATGIAQQPTQALIEPRPTLTTGAAAVRSQSSEPPNLVLILVDDLGYGDLGCYGRHEGPPTPHTDRLAREGVRLTNAYASSPICSATRAGLVTGRYQQRFGYYGNFEFQVGLPLTEKTIAQYLRPSGYTSALIGKWHLGEQPHNHPLRFGFDEFFGFLGGQHDYFDAQLGHTWVRGSQSSSPILHNEDPVEAIDYLTEELTSRAANFIERNKERRFFLMLSYNAIHGPLQVPRHYVDRFSGTNCARDRALAMNAALDDGVGIILETLRSCGLDSRTLIVYCSDNGGHQQSRNAPLRGFKGQRYEGGQRIPFIVRWPGVLPAGAVRHGLAVTLDILPTFLAAAGIDVHKDHSLDGRNLLPYLRGDVNSAPHDVLYWSMNPKSRKWAIREGDWKLVSESRTGLELFQLANDVGETQNLLDEHRDIADRLRRRYEQWIAPMPPSLVTDDNRVEKLEP